MGFLKTGANKISNGPNVISPSCVHTRVVKRKVTLESPSSGGLSLQILWVTHIDIN
jgi:hypothetical protein